MLAEDEKEEFCTVVVGVVDEKSEIIVEDVEDVVDAEPKPDEDDIESLVAVVLGGVVGVCVTAVGRLADDVVVVDDVDVGFGVGFGVGIGVGTGVGR